MPVTELAVLRILPPYTLSSPTLKNVFSKAIKQQSEASGAPGLSIYQQLEDPQIIYLIAHWDSLSAHQIWIESEQNQSLLKELPGLVEIDSMYHINVPKSSLPLNAPVMSIAREYLKPEVGREEWEGVWDKAKVSLETYTKGQMAAGWTVDGKEEEWVVFSGFKNVEEHHGFAKSDGWEEHAVIREYLERFDVKHGKDITRELGEKGE